MKPVSYQFDNKGRELSGKLYMATGQYAGGGINDRNGERIDIRMPDGDVEILELDHVIDPAEYSTITLIYYPKGKRLHLFQLYIHETESFHGIDGDCLDSAVKHILGYGTLRCLWSRFVGKFYLMLVSALALISFYIVKHQARDLLYGLFAAASVGLPLVLLNTRITRYLGNIESQENALKSQFAEQLKQMVTHTKEYRGSSINDGYQPI